jgi:hypothetical protein
MCAVTTLLARVGMTLCAAHAISFDAHAAEQTPQPQSLLVAKATKETCERQADYYLGFTSAIASGEKKDITDEDLTVLRGFPECYGAGENSDVLRACLRAGADPNHRCEPLMRAAANRSLEQVEALVAHGARSRVAGKGQNELHVIAGCGLDSRATDQACREMVSLIIKAGADVNKMDANGDTPLSLATFTGSLTMAELYLSRGADPNAGRVWCDTPLDTVERRSQISPRERNEAGKVAATLRQRGGRNGHLQEVCSFIAFIGLLIVFR